jgi:Glycosyl transferase family 2
MKLAAVTTVRNECDIIEAFARHNAAFFDRLYILDHRSTDATPRILSNLDEEGLPLTLSHADEAVFYQGPMMTQLIKRTLEDRDWDFVLPLDADEFIHAPNRAELEAVLSGLDEATVGLSNLVNYIPTANDDEDELDVLRRIVHRTRTIPDISCKIGKVSIPGAIIKQPGFSLNEGHHGVCVDGKPVAERRLDGLSLAHFPVRSAEQFIMRAILCRLSWSLRSDYDPSWGWHYATFIEQLKAKPAVTAADLTEAALLYVDIYNESGQTPHQKVLAFEPVTPAYGRLRFTDLIDVAVLPPVLDMMDALLGEVRETRNARTPRSRLREFFRIGKKKNGST